MALVNFLVPSKLLTPEQRKAINARTRRRKGIVHVHEGKKGAVDLLDIGTLSWLATIKPSGQVTYARTVR